MDTKGLRVVRGPNWKWGNQDGGEGGVGTVISSNIKGNLLRKLVPLALILIKIENFAKLRRQIDGFVLVAWDSGTVGIYLACDKINDLRILDSSLVGVKHPGMICCGKDCNKEICGMRWQCTKCQKHFCTGCFIKEKSCYDQDRSHDTFIRYETPSSDPVVVTVNHEKRIKLWEMFVNAKVTRGKHWSYGDEDESQIGEVQTMETIGTGKVLVKWKNAEEPMLYRRGLNGKVDLRAEMLTVGGLYEPDWLPPLNIVSGPLFGRSIEVVNEKDTSSTTVGHRVMVKVTTEKELRDKQIESASWHPLMGKEIAKVGMVLGVNRSGNVCVEFKESGKRWCFNPVVLEKLSCFAVGQFVRVRDSKAQYEEMKETYGKRVAMLMIGEVGSIVEENDDGVKILIHGFQASKNYNLKAVWLEEEPLALEKYKSDSKLTYGLVEAASAGKLAKVKHLVKNLKVPADAICKSMDGVTALHMASLNGHSKIVKFLIEEGADPNKKDFKGRQSIYFAAKGGQFMSRRDDEESPPNILGFLANNLGEINYVAQKLTPSHKAVISARLYNYSLYWNGVFNGEILDFNLADENGNTSLHYFFAFTNSFLWLPFSIKSQIMMGQSNRNKWGLNVLQVGVYTNNIRKDWLINYGKSVFENVGDSKTNTLHLACEKSHYTAGKLLLERLKELDDSLQSSAKVSDFINSKDDNGHSPLMIACYQGAFGLVELLVNAGAKIYDFDEDGDSAIILAALRIQMEEAIDQNTTRPSNWLPILDPYFKEKQIPRKEESPDIFEIYAGCKIENDHPMIKYPVLSILCFLIKKLDVEQWSNSRYKVSKLLDSRSVAFLDKWAAFFFNIYTLTLINDLLPVPSTREDGYRKKNPPRVLRIELPALIIENYQDILQKLNFELISDQFIDDKRQDLKFLSVLKINTNTSDSDQPTDESENDSSSGDIENFSSAHFLRTSCNTSSSACSMDSSLENHGPKCTTHTDIADASLSIDGDLLVIVDVEVANITDHLEGPVEENINHAIAPSNNVERSDGSSTSSHNMVSNLQSDSRLIVPMQVPYCPLPNLQSSSFQNTSWVQITDDTSYSLVPTVIVDTITNQSVVSSEHCNSAVEASSKAQHAEAAVDVPASTNRDNVEQQMGAVLAYEECSSTTPAIKEPSLSQNIDVMCNPYPSTSSSVETFRSVAVYIPETDTQQTGWKIIKKGSRKERKIKNKKQKIEQNINDVLIDPEGNRYTKNSHAWYCTGSWKELGKSKHCRAAVSEKDDTFELIRGEHRHRTMS